MKNINWSLSDKLSPIEFSWKKMIQVPKERGRKNQDEHEK